MLPKQDKGKSSKRLLFSIVIVICLWCFWPSEPQTFRRISASLHQVIEKKQLVSPQLETEGSANNKLKSSSIWNSKQKAGFSSESAQLEVCIIDAETQEAIKSGHVTILKEPAESVIFKGDFDQNGCAGFSLNPGRYGLRYDIPGFYCWRSDALEIASNLDRVRKIVEFYRSVTVRGIVKNASRQPQPDAIVIFGNPGSSSSFTPYGIPVNTNNGGEFTANPPSNLTAITIYAAKPPYAIAQVGPLGADEIGHKYLEIILPKEEKTATISGRIIDSEMRPVSGATAQFQAMPSYDPMGKYDQILSMISAFYFRNMVKSDRRGYFTLSMLLKDTGVFHVTANGFEPYQEQLRGITGDITKDIQLKTPSYFSVQVKNSDGQSIVGTNLSRVANNSLSPMASFSGKYYSTKYPIEILAEGIRQNLGITERKLIESYQKEIVIKLGNCEIQGQVTDEGGNPIKNISVTVNSIGEGENELALNGSQHVQYYSENGFFVLRNLVPGKASLSIIGSSNVHDLFERKTLDVVLQEGAIARPLVILKRK
jgi:hypothetical protein